MDTKLENVMKQLGWTDGYHVPLLNEKNTQLTKQIEEMLKEKMLNIIQLEDLEVGVRNVWNHLKDIKHLHRYNQGLVYACKTCKETENHMMKLNINKEKITEREISKYNIFINETNIRIEELEVEIERLKGRINNIETNALFDQETIILWKEEILNQEELTYVIEFYAHEDEIKSKEQSLQLQKLQTEAQSKQQLLEKLTYDVQSQEVALDHASRLFYRKHANRQFLIEQWEGCVSFIGKRDEEIIILRNEVHALLQNISEQKETLQDETCFKFGLELNNKETNLKTKYFDCEANLLWKLVVKSKQRVEDIENEINIVSKNLENTGKLLQQERCHLKFLIKANADLEKCLDKLDEAIGTLKVRLKGVCSLQTSASERRSQLEEVLMAQESNLTEVGNEIKNVQCNIHVNQMHHQKLKDKGLSIINDIHKIESSMKVLTNENIGISKKLVQKFQMAYNLDYLIENLESRVSRMMGYQESSRQDELLKKLNNLERVLNMKSKEVKYLSSQKTKLEEEERRILIKSEADKETLKSLISRNRDELLGEKVTRSRLKECHDSYYYLQMEENVMRLKISKMLSAVDKKGREIFYLEKEFLEIDKLMQERSIEIATEKDILEAKNLSVANEVSLLRGEVRHIQTKISQVKKRYEIISSCFSGDIAKNEEPLSLIQFNLQIAQERQELQEEGDCLEKAVRLAEKEIRSMEAALSIISGTNYAYKNNLIAFEAVSEIADRDLMDKKLLTEVELRRKKKLELSEQENSAFTLSKVIKELDEEILKISNCFEEETVMYNSINMEVEEQILKKNRASNQVKRLQREVRTMMGTISGTDPTFDERDHYMQQLILANRNGMILLVQLQEHNPGIVFQIELFLEEKGLLKLLEMSKMQPKKSSQMLLPSPKLMPPFNTPVSSSNKASFSSDIEYP